ncbi:hypothetical protein SAMN04489722_101388 [Algibacter lectus]|uniref:hypothetical protein n=1 Tax=Algibacter lectus TaxID=221126 RepID=UPI0008F3B36A|nr:hypothetical protein [Algibacter lectus]SFB97970.1 hypothetical protein SAMN04489722_101388 [Algibacter lectus]
MHKILILKAFKKAEADRILLGDKKPSLTNKAEDIADYVSQETGFVLGERSYRDYRKDAEALKISDGDINIKQHKVVCGLLKYLEFDNYEEFKKVNEATINNNPNLKVKKKTSSKFDVKHKITLGVLCSLIIIFLSFKYLNTQRWMSWENDHYIETNFDPENYELGNLKLYNPDRIDNFRKIIPNCDTQFYTETGNTNVWYGKNETGVLEYFTALGKHPTTGKTLKEITDYMIKKHICSDY